MTPTERSPSGPARRPSDRTVETNGAGGSMWAWSRKLAGYWDDPRVRWAVLGFVFAPLVIAVFVVAAKPWAPVLDLAMTELRVRDVGTRHTPLIGLPGRIGNFPDQGSHAGPWYFYLLAPVYRLTGTHSWGIEVGTLLINIGCLAAICWLALRRYGRIGLAVALFAGAILIRGYSMVVLAQPWNPYFPVLVWALGIVAAIGVFDGRFGLAPWVVATTSLAAQTHVPYLTPAVAVNGAVLAWLLYRRKAPGALRAIWFGLGAAAVMWLPPLVDQALRRPGNLKMMFDHFTGPHEEPVIGLGHAFAVVTQHLNIVATGWELVAEPTPFIERASHTDSISIVGAVVLAAWLFAAVTVVRRRDRRLFAVFAMTGLLLAVDWISISRIFGKVWFYLTLWMPTTSLLVWGTIIAAAWSWWSERADTAADARADAEIDAARASQGVVATVAALGAVVFVLMLAIPTWRGVLDYQVPEGSQGAPVLALMPGVVDGLNADVGAATGDDGVYIVYWREAVLSGSQGLALVNELDRRGFTVGVDDTWRVPATQQRVLRPEQATAQIRLVSGPWIDELRGRDGFELLGEVDLRSAAQRARFTELQAAVIDRLNEIGRPELVPDASYSIFKLSLQTLPADVSAMLDEMLEIGVPVAVFVAAPDSPF